MWMNEPHPVIWCISTGPTLAVSGYQVTWWVSFVTPHSFIFFTLLPVISDLHFLPRVFPTRFLDCLTVSHRLLHSAPVCLSTSVSGVSVLSPQCFVFFWFTGLMPVPEPDFAFSLVGCVCLFWWPTSAPVNKWRPSTFPKKPLDVWFLFCLLLEWMCWKLTINSGDTVRRDREVFTPLNTQSALTPSLLFWKLIPETTALYPASTPTHTHSKMTSRCMPSAEAASLHHTSLSLCLHAVRMVSSVFVFSHCAAGQMTHRPAAQQGVTSLHSFISTLWYYSHGRLQQHCDEVQDVLSVWSIAHLTTTNSEVRIMSCV